jgi:hypothetical protein
VTTTLKNTNTNVNSKYISTSGSIAGLILIAAQEEYFEGGTFSGGKAALA